MRAIAIVPVLLLAAAGGCVNHPPPAQETLLPAPLPGIFCTPGERAAGEELVRYECAGRGVSEAARFAIALPVAWEFAEEEGDEVSVFVTRRDGSGIFVRGGDQLPEPRTPADTARFWLRAAEIVLDRVASEREAAELRRDAGDEAGGRFMATRAQTTDTALLHLASLLSASREGRGVYRREQEVRSMGGHRAGYQFEASDRGDGSVWISTVWITVVDGVFYGIVMNGPEADFLARQPLMDRVLASFAVTARTR